MPRRTLTVCAEPGCPELTSESRCAEHKSKPWATSTRRSRLPSDWARRVTVVKRRDRNRCQQCGRHAPDGEVDHIEPGDNHRLTNLQLLCTGPDGCHTRKTTAERIAARWPRHAKHDTDTNEARAQPPGWGGPP